MTLPQPALLHKTLAGLKQYFSVAVKPQIICADKLEAPLYEDDVVLECELLSMPPPEEITWTWYESEDMPVSVHQGEVSGVIKARLMPGVSEQKNESLDV